MGLGFWGLVGFRGTEFRRAPGLGLEFGIPGLRNRRVQRLGVQGALELQSLQICWGPLYGVSVVRFRFQGV